LERIAHAILRETEKTQPCKILLKCKMPLNEIKFGNFQENIEKAKK